MRLVFRKEGNHLPALQIKGVDFVEPVMPTHIKFTAVGCEGMQAIVCNRKGQLVWDKEVYDFVEVFDN